MYVVSKVVTHNMQYLYLNKNELNVYVEDTNGNYFVINHNQHKQLNNIDITDYCQ